MEPIKLQCTYEERTTVNDPMKTYKAVYIKLAPNFEKRVFLSVPETALLEGSISEEASTSSSYNI